MKFEVKVYQTIHQSATIEVEAENETDAEIAALAYYQNEEINWRFEDCDDPEFEVVNG